MSRTIRSHEDRLRSLALFPYVSMRRDPHGRTPLTSLGEAAHVALIHVKEQGPARVLYREDLDKAGLDPVATYLASRERLARLVQARLVGVRTVQGPWRARCLAFQHSFLAASCLVLPNLFYMAKAALKVDAMCIAVPRRDVLVVMPDLGPAFRAATRDLLRQRIGLEDAVPLFALEPSGPGSIHELRRVRAARRSLPAVACPGSLGDEIPVDVELPHDEVTSQVSMSSALSTGVHEVRSIAELVEERSPAPKRAANVR